MADEVQIECSLGVDNLMSDREPKKIYTLVSVTPTGLLPDAKMPLNLALVLDHSGSMAGESKLDNLKTAVHAVLGELQPQDYVSVVLFDDTSEVVIPSRQVGNAADLHAVVDDIEEGGSTEMSRGMRSGLDELRAQLSPQRVSRMLLLTDGQTFGDDDVCLDIASECQQLGVPVTALGLGRDWHKDLLTDIADRTATAGGMAAYIKKPEDVITAFRRAVKIMQATLVRNAYLTLRLSRGVTPRRAWRVLPLISELSMRSLSDRDVQVQLGDIEREVGQAVLVELVTEGRPAGQVRLAQAEVTYEIPITGAPDPRRVRSDLIATFVSDPVVANRRSGPVMDWVAKATVHQLKTQALDAERGGDLAKAANMMRQAATVLLTTGDEQGAVALGNQTKRLDDGQGTSQEYKEEVKMGGATARLTD